MSDHKRVCPWWLCFTFDNPLRRLLHDPEAILRPYVHAGNNVIDVGAGMGFFSIPLARLVGNSGHVTVIDIQTQMLSALRRRAQRAGVSEIITTHLATPDSLGEHSKADLILAFWMAHEVSDQRKFFAEIYNLLKPQGLFLLVEPKAHVPKKSFLQELEIANDAGFLIKDRPEIRMSRSALMERNIT